VVESFIGGFLIAVLFVPIYNFFVGRTETKPKVVITTAPQHQ